jgi:two-component system sensor histidine kinase KdpD
MGAHQRLHVIGGYLGTIGGVVLITLIMWALRAHLTVATAALLYLLVVFSSSVIWGMGTAIVGSILAALAFDYFFVPPVFTLTVASPSETIVIVVFLIVTIVASRLATWARKEAREARQRARESEILYELGQVVAEAGSADEGLAAIAKRAVAAFAVQHCAILLADSLGVLRIQTCYPPGGVVDLTRDEDGVAAYAAHRNLVIPYRSSLHVPVQIGARRVGVLRVGPRPDGQPLPFAEHRLLQTFAAAAAVAIDRRRLQETATQAEILRRSDELKSALLSSVSHDLRTPLATIKAGITAILEESLTLDQATQREVLSAANEEVDRLTRLINNLLDLSRIEAGALRPDRQWYDLGELIGEAVRRIEGRFPDQKISVDVPGRLAPVFVDYVQVQEVVTNLVENAARYAPANTTIDVTIAVESDNFIVRVRDQGPGIPALDAERIFTKFYRIGQQPGGTGLGLAICRGLVEAHGGRVWVENPGRPGAVFAVALPLLAPPLRAESLT